MRSDSNDVVVMYSIAAVVLVLVVVGILGVIFGNWIAITIPLVIFTLMLLLAYALYKRWPIPFLKEG